MAPMSPDQNQQLMAACRALLHELTEALTAIENYARGAQHLAAGQGSEDPGRLVGALEHLIEQVHRAANAMRRFRSLLVPPDADEEGGS